MELERTVKNFLKENYPNKVDETLINYLCDSGIITMKSARDVIAKNDFYKRLKDGQSITSAMFHTSWDWLCSESLLRDLIKKQKSTKNLSLIHI
jgi:hypothetical protein